MFAHSYRAQSHLDMLAEACVVKAERDKRYMIAL